MKSNKKKIFFIIMIAIFSIGLVYGSYKVLTWKKDNNEVTEIKEELEELIDVEVVEEEPTYSVNFQELKKKNSDTVAYLKVNNTKIDYVVVKSKDNSYYLTHNFNKKYNIAGWVFADYHNKFDGTDKNIVVFGHNMKSGSMFGTLKWVFKKDWLSNKDNRYITFITEDGEHVYEVFSIYTVKAEMYYMNTIFKDNDEFYKFLTKVNKRSTHNFGVELSKEDSILTLSTCSSGSSYRTVLHAKKIK